ncbi:MAG: hypothetical protein QW166_03505 [Candidatus Bathyarchaeia archaeon]
MARINYKADSKAEASEQYNPAPEGIYTLQIVEHSDGEVTKGGKYPGTPMTKLICEIADKGEHFGKRIWHNVVWVPRGNGKKANSGHGIAVHFLHAIGLPYDGEFEFDESELQGRTFRALVGIKTYEKLIDGKKVVCEKNYIKQVYTENHPEPKTLPILPEIAKKFKARIEEDDKDIEVPF